MIVSYQELAAMIRTRTNKPVNPIIQKMLERGAITIVRKGDTVCYLLQASK